MFLMKYFWKPNFWVSSNLCCIRFCGWSGPFRNKEDHVSVYLNIVVSIYIVNNCPFLFCSLHELNSTLYPQNLLMYQIRIRRFIIYITWEFFLYLIYFRFWLTFQLVLILSCIIIFHSHDTAATHILNYIDYNFDNIS